VLVSSCACVLISLVVPIFLPSCIPDCSHILDHPYLNEASSREPPRRLTCCEAIVRRTDEIRRHDAETFLNLYLLTDLVATANVQSRGSRNPHTQEFCPSHRCSLFLPWGGYFLTSVPKTTIGFCRKIPPLSK
jgi:hypothetical protein